jgi:hypothetical protein
MVAGVLLVRHSASATWVVWKPILLALAVGYTIFIAASLMFLDNDDRVVAEAIWAKVAGLARQSAQ